MSLTLEDAKALLTEAFRILNEKLKPAKLADTQGNGMRLVEWAKEVNGGNIPQTAPAFADALERAVKIHLQDGQLEWLKEPKALTATKELSGPMKLKSAAASQEEFNSKVQQGREADAYANQQKAARQRIKSLLESFLPINKRGAVDYAMKERVVQELSQKVAKYEQQGADMTKVADAVSDEIQRVYEIIEKSRERI